MKSPLHYVFLLLFTQVPSIRLTPLQFKIPEELPTGTVIGRIPKTPSNRYHLTNDHGFFALDSSTGEICLIKKIDRDRLLRDIFELVIVNQDQSGFPITVTVQVQDINDNAPVFPRSFASMTFLETEQIGQQILLDQATDEDSPLYGTIARYAIISGNEGNIFRLIKTETGNENPKQHFLHVENLAVLDKETRDNYLLNISATDNGHPSRSGYFLLNISIGDINDNSPVFDPSEYVVALNENSPAFSPVLKVHATDNDEVGSNSRIVYSLTNATQFTIDQNGVIRTTQNKTKCPRNKCQQNDCPRTCVLTVEGRDGGEPFLTGRAYVYITLIDENDHPPEITFRYYPSASEYATVAEDAPNGTTVALVSVRDLDDGMNGKVNVYITSGNLENQFRMDAVQTHIHPMQLAYLRVNGRLDRLRTSSYNLSITAVDSGHPSLNTTKYLMVIVNDVNDHPPVFQSQKYESHINEMLPVGSFVQAVSATDADGAGINGKIAYSVVSGDQFGWFTINQETGLVTTIRPLDREMTSFLQLNISARDSAPNPRISYTTLIVTIQDANDNAPRFTHCPRELLIKENIPIGTFIYQFSALDSDVKSNGLVSYKIFGLDSGQRPELFTLDEKSGKMTTRGQLDREVQPVHKLLVIAHDHGHPSQSSSCSVTVKLLDENDNSPVFYPIYYTVPINNKLAAGHKITTVRAADADEGDVIRYAILFSSHNGITVDELSGRIWANQEILLSHGDLIKLQITATDSLGAAAQTSAIVLLFTPLSEKKFSFLYPDQQFVVKENSASPAEIGKVQLLQHDTWKHVQYFITEGDPRGIFSLDSTTGVLKVMRPLDREEISLYQLKLSAWMSPYFTTTTITVSVEDVNDNAPVITNLKGEDAKMDIPVPWPVGAAIVTIEAFDADSGVNGQLGFALLHFSTFPDMSDKQSDAPSMFPFSVNQTSGSVYLRSQLDPVIESAKLTVQVSDGLNLTTKKDIDLRFIRKSCPMKFLRQKWTITIAEDTPVNTRLMTVGVQACRKETPRRVSYQIPHGNDEGHFAIFPDGQLYINATLSRDVAAYYVLKIAAEESDRTAFTTVFVHITDSNNHVPQFINLTYSFEMEENLPAGSFVGRVRADDNDLGLNGELFYRISPLWAADLFHVDGQTGIIRSKILFDRENLPEASATKTGTFSFFILGTDRSILPPQRTGTAAIRIKIGDQNDNQPIFTQQVYEQSVSERTPVGERIIAITANDADFTANGQVTYGIKCPSCLQVFTVDPLTGIIRVNHTFNYQTRSRYDFVVFATDQAANHTLRQTSTAEVIVKILDENAVPPTFVNAEGSGNRLSLTETVTAGSFLIQTLAVETNSISSELLYTITDGNPDKIFRINRFGQVYLNYPLDYERMKFHNITVSASANSPDKTSFTYVYIEVQDANDNAPKFSEFTKSTVRIAEDISPGSVVATVLAHDEDSGPNGEIRYSILYTEPVNGHFIINELTGQISTKVVLDRERHHSYRLVLQACDQAEPESARQSSEKVITIILEDVNDHAPNFLNPHVVIVPEYANSGYRILTVSAQDPDFERNGHVTYDLTRTADMERFHLDRYDGHVYLRGDLKQIAPRYALTVLARDQSGDAKQSSTITIDLVVASGVGAGTVTFAQSTYEWTVHENETVGHIIGTVFASASKDTSEAVEYFLTGVTGFNGDLLPCVFDVHQRSGQVIVKGSLDADQGADDFIIVVHAGLRRFANYEVTSTRIHLKVLSVNNHPPVFSSPYYRFRLEPGVEAGSKIGQIAASDIDREDTVTYFLQTVPESESFSINRETGELFVKIIPKNSSRLCFPVIASDSVHRAEVICCVGIPHVSSFVPSFTKEKYDFLVIWENLEDGEQIAGITAVGFGDAYEYVQASDWQNSWFHVDRRTGAVSITKSSYFKNSSQEEKTVVLRVLAANPTHFAHSSTMLHIHLLPTRFHHKLSKPVSVVIAENAPVGSCFADIFDAASPLLQRDLLPQMIIHGDPQGLFSVSPEGAFCLQGPLDRESHDFHNLSVTVNCGAFRTEYFIAVTVQDINDKAPVFTSELPKAIMLPGDLPVGEEVLVVRAVDPDTGTGGDVQYMLNPEDSEFSIDPLTGVIRLAEKLSYDKKPEHALRVIAFDKGNPSFTSTAIITVKLQDGSAIVPVIPQKIYQIQIPENTAIGHHVLTVTTVRGSVSGSKNVRYWIVAGNDGEMFEIDTATGQVFTAKMMDFEEQQRYELTVMAENALDVRKNTTALVIVEIVNVNDESPRFESDVMKASIKENFFESPRTRILQLSVVDDDAAPFNSTIYKIVRGDLSLFHIDEKDGWVSILRPLDREAQDMHKLEVQAPDADSRVGATTLLETRVIDENDNPPKFTGDVVFYATENCRRGNFVGFLAATDEDENATLKYTLTGHHPFAVDSFSGRITTIGDIDRESIAEYEVVVQVSDGIHNTKGNIVIKLVDEDDNSPVFLTSLTAAYVPEDIPPGGVVYVVQATDEDENGTEKLTYRLIPSTSQFRLHPHSGVLEVSAVTLPQETFLTVQASDPAGNSATMTLQLLPEKRERFPSFLPGPRRFAVLENSENSKPIIEIVAKCGFGQPVTYRLAAGNTDNNFSISPETGELVANRKLDYERSAVYDLWIEATATSDGKSFATFENIKITVENQNDNAPKFSEQYYNADLDEETVGVQVIRFAATDADGDEIFYSLLNGSDVFRIDAETGVLTAVEKTDREKTQSVTVMVQATDRIFTSTVPLHVRLRDKNDNPPKFTRQFTANVTENSPLGTFVLKVTSTDADAPVNAKAVYSLTKTYEMFDINSDTGDIRVAGKIDREKLAEVPLEIAVRDGAWQSKTLAMITILPENDRPPFFEEPEYRFFVQETSVVPSFVGAVKALDGDQDEQPTRIFYSLRHPSDIFAVDRVSGRITTKKPVRTADAPQENIHRIAVLATEETAERRTAITTVICTIIGATEVVPQFTQSIYVLEVPMNLSAEVLLMQLELRTSAAYLPKFLMSGNKTSSDCFKLDPVLGVLTTSKDIMNCSAGQHRIHVTATFTQTGSGAKTEVLVQLTNSTMFLPRFSASTYEISVLEGIATGSVIFTAAVESFDTLPPGQVQYLLKNLSETFQIDPLSGAVRIKKPLDFEQSQKFALTIVARGHFISAPSASTTVLVSVINENDNPPVFPVNHYSAVVFETQKLGVQIGNVTAVDPDDPEQYVYYSIESDSSYFAIDSTKGVISNTKELDYESFQNHSLVIRALDPSDPSLFSDTVFSVVIADRNEFPLECPPGVTIFTVSAKAPIGSRVGQIMGTDNDKSFGGKRRYQLVGQENNFEIDSKSGEITLVADLSGQVATEILLHVLITNPVFATDPDSCLCDVVVHVVDGTHVPYFGQREYFAKVKENVPIGKSVIGVSATTEGQQKIQYMIVAGDETGRFAIDGKTGEVTVVRTLDRETIPQHSLKILARVRENGEWMTSAIVNVTVEDINDNAPVLDPTQPEGHVKENCEFETTIVKINATDKDLGPHFFTYRMVSPEWKDHLRINPSTGVVSSIRPFDREKISEVKLKVSVTDSGIPAKTSFHELKITVDDINDSPSAERPLTIVVYITESGGKFINRRIGNIQPLDADTTGDYKCQIIGGSSNSFSVENGCDLTAADLLPGNIYRLDVRGSDGKHAAVVYEAVIKSELLTKGHQENSISIQLADMNPETFLENNYVRLMQSLYSVFGNFGQAVIFGVTKIEKDCVIQIVATKKDATFLEPGKTIALLKSSFREIEQRSGVRIIDIDYKPCKAKNSCSATTVCQDVVQMIPHQSSIISSSNLILAVSQFEYSQHCTCPRPFSGPQCELQCPPDLCQNGGSCVNNGKCLCPAGFFGSQCQFDLDECNLWGLPNCFNGGKCVNTFGSFRCECPEGFTGKQCDETRECTGKGCTIESSNTFGFSAESFMELPSLKATGNEISLVMSTMSSEGLLAFSQGPVKNGISHFMLLEIKKGLVYFAFGSTARDTTRITVNKVVSDGKWYKVDAVKEESVGSLSVTECTEVSCSSCPPGDEKCSTVAVGVARKQDFATNSLFFGNIPSSNRDIDENRLSSRYFLGCVKNLFVNQVPVSASMARRTFEISENTCSLSGNICQLSPCSTNEICVNSQDGHFECVIAQPAHQSTLIAVLTVSLLLSFILAAALLYYFRRPCRKSKTSHQSNTYGRPPFLSPMNLLEPRYAPRIYQPGRSRNAQVYAPESSFYKSDLCMYHASQRASPHYYCVLPDKSDRPPSHYASTGIYEMRHAYVNDASISAMKSRKTVISPSAVSEDPQLSSTSTQPVDIVSLNSDGSGNYNRTVFALHERDQIIRTEDLSDVCSDCENCKSTKLRDVYGENWADVGRYEQPTYAEVHEFLEEIKRTGQITV